MIRRDDSATVAITLNASCNPVNLTIPLNVPNDKNTKILIRTLEIRRLIAFSKSIVVRSRLLFKMRAVNNAIIPAPKSRMKIIQRGTIFILRMNFIV